MTLPLSPRARTLLNQTNVKGQIIVEIDGFEDEAIFGAVDVEKFATIGEDDLVIGEFIIGGTVKNSLSKPYISAKGTTSRVNQQIIPDQGGSSSIQKMNIRFIDKNGEVAKLFSPGQVVSDLHGKKCRVYAGFQNGAHPEDSVLVLNGIIKMTKFGPGYVQISVGHPQELERIQVFTKFEGVLDGAIDDSQTIITLDNTDGLLLPEDILKTFILIDNELIEYTGISGNDLTGCVRGSTGANGVATLASSHADDTDVESVYRLEENVLTLALKLIFSGPNEFFSEGVDVSSFQFVSPSLTVPNAIVFNNSDIESRYGLTVGDLVTVVGATEGANNISLRAITGFGQDGSKSYITVDGASLTTETGTSATISFKSQYRTLTQTATGANLSGEQVDVERFLFWESLFGPIFPTYRFDIIDPVESLKEFLDIEVYKPAGLYSVPRKGKISLHFNTPPLALDDVVVLDTSNVINPNKIEIERSTNKFFYNSVEYAYNKETATDKFRRRDLRISQDSLDRIEVGIKKLLIESGGLRQDLDATAVIDSIERRLIQRYRFGAERIRGLRTNYKTGMPLEVADSVVVDGNSLRLVDTSRGDRNFSPRLFEVINKTWDIIKGEMVFDLLDTGFEVNFRVGVMGPSSFIGTGSTTTNIRIKRSFTTPSTDLEINKWEPYIGQKIKIRADDYSFNEEVKLVGFLEGRNDTIIVSPALSSSPPEDYILDMPDYSGGSNEKGIWKNIHCFVCPVVDVVTGISDTEFDVSPADISQFFIGGFVRVHSDDFTDNSERLEIIDIDGNTITVENSLGFTPSPGYQVRPIGFSDDNGLPYNYL